MIFRGIKRFQENEKWQFLEQRNGSDFQFPGVPKPHLFARLLSQGTRREATLG